MSHTAELIAVGTELLLGNIANTDAQMLSQGLAGLGINVYYHTVVGDNPARLRAAVETAKGRADIIITTGGLGPTYDDLTKEVLAESFGKKLVLHEPSLERIRRYFEEKLPHRVMTENNSRQAMLPEGCVVFDNDWGTAPGCAFEAEGLHVLMLPGPPRECEAMYRHRAVHYLRALSDEPIFSRNLCIFGMGESLVEDRLHGMMTELVNPSLAPYAKEGEVLLRVTAKAENEASANAAMQPVIDRVYEKLGDVIYCEQERGSLAETVFSLLKSRGLSLAAAESCTGGMLAAELTGLPGASAVFRGGVVAYTNEVKTALLGVDAELLARSGAVSEAVALEMARGAAQRLGADIGVGISGLAGPDGDGTDTPVGTVFVALHSAEGDEVKRLELGEGRARVRMFAVKHAFDMVRRHLIK